MPDDLPFQKLERLFHEPARLAILALLVNEPRGLSFTELRDRLDLTFGNLDRHLKTLSEGGVIEVVKRTGSGRPQTTVSLSEEGRRQFIEYLDSLEAVLQAASEKATQSKSKEEPGLGGLPSTA